MASSVCTICVDDFENSGDICSTVCGHVFHFSCLQQWQERSNTCPMCNRSNPQPHRLFLDITTAEQSAVVRNDDCNENVVILKGIQQHQITAPLYAIVLNLAYIMKLSIQRSDIRDVSRNDNNLRVAFYAARHKDMFIENKFKLKNDSQTSGVIIHELLDEETNELYRHAHQLKKIGYKIIFVKNKKIYVKKDQEDIAINICSKNHVDLLCGKTQNSTPSQLANTTAKRTRRTVKSARPHNTATDLVSQLTNTVSDPTHRGTVASSLPYNETTATATKLPNTAAKLTPRSTVKSANKRQTSRVIIHERLDEETNELYRHAHQLKNFGYKIIFVKNKKIYVKKNQEDIAIKICSKNHVDSLCGKTLNYTPSQLANTTAKRTRSTVKSARPHNTATDLVSQLTNTVSDPTHRCRLASSLPYNETTASAVKLPNTESKGTPRNTTASAPPYNEATTPAGQLTNTAASRTHRSTVASAPPYNAVFDRNSADLIRRIMMDDYIKDSLHPNAMHVHGEINLPNRQDNNRLLLDFADQEQEITWRRYDNQSINSPQTTSFRNSIISIFQNIARNGFWPN